MNEFTAFLLGVAITAFAILPYLITQRASALKRKEDELAAKVRKMMPYLWKSGLEDTASFNIRMLMDIRDFLTCLEYEIENQRQLIGQIRNGEYQKDQPAAPRVRANGHRRTVRE